MNTALRKMREEGLVICFVNDGNDAWSLTAKGRQEATSGRVSTTRSEDGEPT
jgi:hypothetical protein